MASINRGIIVIFMILFVILNIVTLATNQNITKKYAVIIDAGSTGSRVLAFSFKKTNGGALELENELFKEVKPSLSNYTKEPKNGADSLKELLNHAENFVPIKYQNSTPLALKATAGLRLLPKNEADALLNEIKNLFKTYTFKTNEKSVAIMEGDDEGLFSWFTVNFLLGNLNDELKNTVAALDLGGGSLQITYIHTGYIEPESRNYEYIKKHKIMNKEVNLYCQSYKNLGLMTARKGIFKISDDQPPFITSPCVQAAAQNILFKFGENEYRITGAQLNNGSAIDYQQCKNIIEDFIKTTIIDKPHLGDQKIVAFSYFYDRAKDAHLDETNLTIKSFYDAAEKECSKTIYEESNAFKCLDLIYISVLLEVGFGLSKETSVSVLKTINGYQISWALGAAYHILQNDYN